MFLVSSCSCLYLIHLSRVLNGEWRCSCSSADRRCSIYICVINDFIAHKVATYIIGLRVCGCKTEDAHNHMHIQAFYITRVPSYNDIVSQTISRNGFLDETFFILLQISMNGFLMENLRKIQLLVQIGWRWTAAIISSVRHICLSPNFKVIIMTHVSVTLSHIKGERKWIVYNSLFRLITQETSTLLSTGALWGDSPGCPGAKGQ